MSLSNNQKGTSLIVVLLAIAVVAILGVAGYRVMTADPLASNSSDSFSSQEPETLKNPADVQRAEKSLDTVDMGNPDQLNQDSNDL